MNFKERVGEEFERYIESFSRVKHGFALALRQQRRALLIGSIGLPLLCVLMVMEQPKSQVNGAVDRIPTLPPQELVPTTDAYGDLEIEFPVTI